MEHPIYQLDYDARLMLGVIAEYYGCETDHMLAAMILTSYRQLAERIGPAETLARTDARQLEIPYELKEYERQRQDPWFQ